MLLFMSVAPDVQNLSKGYQGKALNPGSWDCIIYTVGSVALLTIGVLGLTGTICSTTVGASFLVLTLLPPAIVLARSKNSGAWSIFVSCLIPLFAGISGAALTGAIPRIAISAIAITTASLHVCSLSSFASTKL